MIYLLKEEEYSFIAESRKLRLVNAILVGVYRPEKRDPT